MLFWLVLCWLPAAVLLGLFVARALAVFEALDAASSRANLPAIPDSWDGYGRGGY